MSELSDAVWNYAQLQGADFETLIWTGRSMRPLAADGYVFLADAIEAVASTYSSVEADPAAELKQAAVDIAVAARRGDLATALRNKVGGGFEQLEASAWAEWLSQDSVPAVIRDCTFPTSETVGNQRERWVYIDQLGLAGAFAIGERVWPEDQPEPGLLHRGFEIAEVASSNCAVEQDCPGPQRVSEAEAARRWNAWYDEGLAVGTPRTLEECEDYRLELGRSREWMRTMRRSRPTEQRNKPGAPRKIGGNK